MDMFRIWQERQAYAEKLASLAGRPDLIPHIRMAVLAGEEGLYKDLLQLLNDILLVTQPEAHPFLPVPLPEELPNGEFLLGQLVGADYGLWLPREAPSEGIGVFGTIGSGKTFFLAWLIHQFIQAGIKVWIFNKDADMPQLLADLLRTEKMIPLEYRRAKRNVLESAPLESPRETIARVEGVLTHTKLILDGGRMLFDEIVTGLFAEAGVFNGSERYPCLLDVADRLDTYNIVSNRGRDWLVTLRSRVGSMARNFPEVYGVSRGYPLLDLLDHSILWDFQGFEAYDLNFAISDLLSWVLAYRQRELPGRLTHVFVIDEAHRLAPRVVDGAYGEPVLLEAARTSRKAGIGLAVADQVPSGLAPELRANLGTRVSFRLFDGADIQAIAGSMSLTREQAHYLPVLGPRKAVVHTKLLNRACLIEVPELGI